jgi:hypothetical protein
MSTLFVYAFSGTPVPPFAVGARRIRTLDVEGVHVVADRAVPPDATSEAALRLQHAIVEAIATRADAVLPARAGSVIDLDELRTRIARSRAAIHAALDLVRGREQMTLRLAAAPLRERPGAIHRPTEAGAMTAVEGSGTAYLEARRAATLPPAEVLAAVRALVSGLVHAERLQPARGALPAAVYHLVPKGQGAEYRRRIEGAPELAGSRPTITGPWPPFAFTPELPA